MKFSELFPVAKVGPSQGAAVAVADEPERADLQELMDGLGELRADLTEVAARAGAAFKLAGVSGLMAARTSQELRRLAGDGFVEEADLQAAEERFTNLLLQIVRNPDWSGLEVEAMISERFSPKVNAALVASLAEAEVKENDAAG